MSWLRLRGVTLSYGRAPLLDGVDLQVQRGERVCLLGRNGAGKTSLLRVVARELSPDDGEVLMADGLRVARLPQEVPQGLAGPVFDVVATGLADLGDQLAQYHHLSLRLAEQGGTGLLARLETVQHELEAAGGWHLNQRVESILSRLALDAEADFASLSGGLKRRVLLARALVAEPDLLILDEPTNHLDLEGIRWLEEFLLGFPAALLFVTHDRMFLQRLATRIVELDRGRLYEWPGDYASYLRRKQAALTAEVRQEAEFDRKLSREEAWIRQGIRARRTRNEGRVRSLERMREERQARRLRPGTARLALQAAEASGRLVVEAEDVDYAYQGAPFIRAFSTTIMRGDKVGIIGPNGCGKTTLLQILLGQLSPSRGTVRTGTRLEVAYFDQHRARLDDDKTVLDNVAGGRETLSLAGKSRHVISYLQDFLFTPDRVRSPVRTLSGGERNRLLLARLFTRSSNLLVMDEPTNDLDMETLELLEEKLLDYEGTLLLVSHDRAFLNNVVTSTLVFEGNGRVNDYVGGYDDWQRQRRQPDGPRPQAGTPRPAAPRPRSERPKLAFKEQRELVTLPEVIETLEAEQASLHAALADPALYQQDGGKRVAQVRERLGSLEAELEVAYRRWEDLEARQGWQ
jgi:ATP-binding cassette subfamily F protein uup